MTTGSVLGRWRRVLAVRHAPTAAAGLCVGNAEVPCTLSLRDAAENILLSVAKGRFAGVWASPIERCRGPAAAIAENLRIPLRIDDRLREISLGDWQLRSWASIEASEPERYKSWMENWLTQGPPGGERVADLLLRVEGWWNQLASGDHLLVSHAGVNRALRVLVHRKSWTQSMAMPVPHLESELFEQFTPAGAAHGER